MALSSIDDLSIKKTRFADQIFGSVVKGVPLCFVATPNCGGAYPVGCSYIIQLGLQVVSKQQSCCWNMHAKHTSLHNLYLDAV